MSIVKSDFKVNDRVSHPTLGEGDILDLYPHGEEVVAVISFEKWGQKKIVLSYVKLTIVEVPKTEEKAEEKGEAKKSKKTVKKSAASKKTPRTKAEKKKAKKAKKAKKK